VWEQQRHAQLTALPKAHAAATAEEEDEENERGD